MRATDAPWSPPLEGSPVPAQLGQFGVPADGQFGAPAGSQFGAPPSQDAVSLRTAQARL